MIENTLVLIKPDALQRNLTGHVVFRLAQAGLYIVGAKVVQVSDALAHEHYKHLRNKPFFPELIRYIKGELHGKLSSGVLAFVYRGENAVQKVRDVAGATHPEQADPKSLRGAYGRITTKGVMENVIHASSDPAEAQREIGLWFAPEEIVDLEPAVAGNASRSVPRKAKGGL